MQIIYHAYTCESIIGFGSLNSLVKYLGDQPYMYVVCHPIYFTYFTQNKIQIKHR